MTSPSHRVQGDAAATPFEAAGSTRSTFEPGHTPAPRPLNEAARLAALRSYAVLDTEPEQAFDDLTQLASLVCGAPISLVSLVDEQRQWFKSRVGIDAAETPREVAFCAHAILEPGELFEVPDSHDDARFAGNPLVRGAPHVRAYAGAPLVSSQGQALGTLCVIDREPRTLTATQRAALRALARQAVSQLELRRAAMQARHESSIDLLTGASNRRGFEGRLADEWSRLGRLQHPLALLILDIDHFKSFNDSFGHPAGDGALRQFAETVRKVLRPSDLLTRWGGEEFAVLLPGTRLEAAVVVAQRIRGALADAVWPHREVTASVGVAAVRPGPRWSPHELVAQADQALYRAKQQGRNCVRAAGQEADVT